MIEAARYQLIQWFEVNKRDLPWRGTRDPYSIWISEIMLQQTTVTAVKPYYENFLAKFPNVQKLAKARSEELLKLWAGLGYYSRARNLHKAAKEFAKTGFPKTHTELINYPGLGPYTARAVASLAFDAPVGVLDGNVIRLLSRYYGQRIRWWESAGRELLQKLADDLAQATSSSVVNQALMELGATVCTPKNPSCLLCPWLKTCEAQAQGLTDKLPLKKSRPLRQIWIWEAQICQKKGKILLIKNSYAPFLKGQWLLPGKAIRRDKPPAKFDFRHSITHHDIYVRIKRSPVAAKGVGRWEEREKVPGTSPFSIVRKALECLG